MSIMKANCKGTESMLWQEANKQQQEGHGGVEEEKLGKKGEQDNFPAIAVVKFSVFVVAIVATSSCRQILLSNLGKASRMVSTNHCNRWWLANGETRR